MNQYLKVSTSSMKHDAERIEKLNGTIPNLIKELEVSMTQLSGCWEGVAWAAYQKNVALHIEMLTDIYDYMSRYTMLVKEAEKKYGYAEQDICAELRKLLTIF